MRSVNFNGGLPLSCVLCATVTFTAGGEERPDGNICPSISPRPEKSALNQNFKDPSPGDKKVHIKFHRVLPTTLKAAKKVGGKSENSVRPRGGRDLAALKKPTEVAVEGNYFLGRDGEAVLATAEGLRPDEFQDVIDAILLCYDGRRAISAWKHFCQPSRLAYSPRRFSQHFK